MNRDIANIIRYLMDEWIPPIIRDNRCFMYPFFYLAYRGKNLKQVMDFKKYVYQFTPEEYDRFYNNLNTISRNRSTDINTSSLNFILNNLHQDAKNLIDVGCGKGYLLKQIKKKNPLLQLSGVDVVGKYASPEFEYVKGTIENLPFPDKSFDVVTCCHTLEHIVNLEKAIAELKRVVRKQLIIAVPCQRYFYYTLDEHINFFPFKEKLTSAVNIKKSIIEKMQGDWIYVGYPDPA